MNSEEKKEENSLPTVNEMTESVPEDEKVLGK